MENHLKGQALLILGAPRSGTSAVANAFRILGYYLGADKDFPEAKEGNPMGIFERTELLEFNGKCLDELYLRHDRPDLGHLSEHPAYDRLVNEASDLLRRLFSGHDRWGWKEPQTTLLAPIYLAALRRDDIQPGHLICVRRPAEVIKSQSKIMEQAQTNREAPLGVRAYRRWLTYTLKSLTCSNGVRHAVVTYHQLVADPRGVLEGSFRAVTGGDLPNSHAMEAACASIRPELHRNKGEADVPSDAPELVQDLWTLCCEICLDPNGLREGKYSERISELEANYDLLSACFSDPEPPHCSVLFYVGPGNPVFTSRVIPTGRWNEVVVDIQAGPSTTLLGMLYPMPANVYVRNPRWANGRAEIRPAGETVEQPTGDSTRYTVVTAPPQITVRTPAAPGPHRLTMEVFVEMNIFIALDASTRQTRIIRAMEQHIGTLTSKAAKLEEENKRLRLGRPW